MKPHEFWDSTYEEAKLYVESRSFQCEFEIKQQVQLMNNLGDKLISAGLTSKNPKNVDLIKEVYKDLFKEELEKESIYNRKASEGEELVNLMLELSRELKTNANKEE